MPLFAPKKQKAMLRLEETTQLELGLPEDPYSGAAMLRHIGSLIPKDPSMRIPLYEDLRAYCGNTDFELDQDIYLARLATAERVLGL